MLWHILAYLVGVLSGLLLYHLVDRFRRRRSSGLSLSMEMRPVDFRVTDDGIEVGRADLEGISNVPIPGWSTWGSEKVSARYVIGIKAFNRRLKRMSFFMSRDSKRGEQDGK